MAKPETSPLFPVVAAALVDRTGRVLLQRRPEGGAMAGLWELPGGKLEAGETPEAALARELEEELGIEVARSDMRAACFASAPLGRRHLLLLTFIVTRWSGEPVPLIASGLRWATPAEMRDLAMPPADEPLIDLLEALLSDRRQERR